MLEECTPQLVAFTKIMHSHGSAAHLGEHVEFDAYRTCYTPAITCLQEACLSPLHIISCENRVSKSSEHMVVMFYPAG